MSKPDMHSSSTPRTSTIAGINVVTPPSKGADEKAHSLRVQKLSGQWKQHVGAAKVAWGKLTQDQLHGAPVAGAGRCARQSQRSRVKAGRSGWAEGR